MASRRFCVMCGADIEDRRSDAMVCGPNCGWRYKNVVAILKFADGGRHGCMDAYSRRSAMRRAKLKQVIG